MSKTAKITAAAVLAMPLLWAASASSQQPQSGAGTTPSQSASQLPTGACRVKDRIGGRTCTGDVPESACVAIAKEARGTYTWTPEECP